MSKKKVILAFLLIISFLVMSAVVVYIKVLPNVISSREFLQFVQEITKKSINAELVITKPVLKTSVKPNISLKVEDIILTKDGKTILNIKNMDSEISFKKILSKKIILRKLGADDIFVDVNEIMSILPKEEEKKETEPFPYKILWFNSELYLKNLMVLYKANDDLSIKLLAKDLEITKTKEPKYIHFKIFTQLTDRGEKLKIGLRDRDNIYIKDKKLHIDNFEFIVNRSKVYVNAHFAEDKFDFKINSNQFKIRNVEQLLESNLIVPNGREIMSYFKDTNGDFKFNFHMTNKTIKGNAEINKITCKLIPLADIPVTLNSGKITFDEKNIEIKDIKGFYGVNKINDILMNGTVKDYTKKVDTEMLISGFATDELAKYISKLAGFKLNLIGKSKFVVRVLFDASSKMQITSAAKVPVGSDVLIEGSTISSNKFDRAVGLKMFLLGNDLNIEHINYYISEKIAENERPDRPLISIKSNISINNGYVKDLSFNIPEPLPSEFFNVLINQRLFRNGTISGHLDFINGKKPYLKGALTMKDVFVTGQRLSIKNGTLSTKNGTIHLTANGRFRRTNYTFDGDIKNEILFPIVVKNVDLNIDDLDVEKLMQTFAPRKPLTEEQRKEFLARRQKMLETQSRSDVSTKYFEVEEKTETKPKEESSDETPITFMPDLIAVEKCNLNLKKGTYKQINFGNLHANLTLTPKGVLEVKSNKFDFADGISTLKVYCDLAKEKYFIRLGAKDVDSDKISTAILNLPREISGKASALLEFNTDNSAKLNGAIKFEINQGSIAKLGLVQYILNFAAIFRNPIVMISPTTLIDIVNIPEGTFKNINGTLKLKDNKIERMMIKSSSPQLSSFIVGQINLENMDASLRIYTKFSNKHKGVAGILRNLSLNSLSKKMSFGSQETASYYAAELSMLPKLDVDDENAQVFLTTVDGDVQTGNFLSSLKKVK